jgi:acetyltransferase-like isoleucine patch superfamily enzyme
MSGDMTNIHQEIAQPEKPLSSRLWRLRDALIRRVERLYWQRIIVMADSARVSLKAQVVHGANVSIGARSKILRYAVLDCSDAPFASQPSWGYKASGHISIGERTSVRPYALLYTYGGEISLGDRCTVNPFTVIYGHGGVVIGNDVHIATHSVIVSSNHLFGDANVTIAAQGVTRIGIVIEDDVWIGAGARVLDGVRIGRGAVVAAGAVVTKDIVSLAVVGGVPARVLSMRTGCAHDPNKNTVGQTVSADNSKRNPSF